MASNFGNMPVANMSSMEGEQPGLDAQFDKMVQTRQSMPMPDWQNVPSAKQGAAQAAPQQSDEALMGPPYNPNGARGAAGGAGLQADAGPSEVSLRDVHLIAQGDRALARKIAPELFSADGSFNPSGIKQDADGSYVTKLGDRQAWASAAKIMTAESHASIKATQSMTLEAVDGHLAGADDSTIHAVKTFMEHKADHMWDGNDPKAQAARAITGPAAIEMAQARGVLPGQKVIPFSTPNGATGQLDLGSGILSTVDHATGEVKKFPKAQGDQVLQQLFAGDQKFFREVTHAGIPMMAKPDSKAEELIKKFKQPDGQVAKKNDKNATLEEQDHHIDQMGQNEFHKLRDIANERRDNRELDASGGDYNKYTANMDAAIKNRSAPRDTRDDNTPQEIETHRVLQQKISNIQAEGGYKAMTGPQKEAEAAYKKETNKLWREYAAKGPAADPELAGASDRRLANDRAYSAMVAEAGTHGKEGSPERKAAMGKAYKARFEKAYADLQARKRERK